MGKRLDQNFLPQTFYQMFRSRMRRCERAEKSQENRMNPVLCILGGCNGAGKTTLARELRLRRWPNSHASLAMMAAQGLARAMAIGAYRACAFEESSAFRRHGVQRVSLCQGQVVDDLIIKRDALHGAQVAQLLRDAGVDALDELSGQRERKLAERELEVWRKILRLHDALALATSKMMSLRRRKTGVVASSGSLHNQSLNCF